MRNYEIDLVDADDDEDETIKPLYYICYINTSHDAATRTEGHHYLRPDTQKTLETFFYWELAVA